MERIMNTAENGGNGAEMAETPNPKDQTPNNLQPSNGDGGGVAGMPDGRNGRYASNGRAGGEATNGPGDFQPTRVGKIGRLDRKTRHELNVRLDDGEPGPALLVW